MEPHRSPHGGALRMRFQFDIFSKFVLYLICQINEKIYLGSLVELFNDPNNKNDFLLELSIFPFICSFWSLVITIPVYNQAVTFWDTHLGEKWVELIVKQ